MTPNTSNSQLPRIESSAYGKNSLLGGLQIFAGIVIVIVSFINIIVINIMVAKGNVGGTFSDAYTLFFVIRWALAVFGTWLICSGHNRLSVNGTFNRLRNYLVNNNLTIQHLSELMGEPIDKLLYDISIMQDRGYWRKLIVTDNSIEICPNRLLPTNNCNFIIKAEPNMRFNSVLKHPRFPHPVLAVCFIALAVIAPLPFKRDIFWIVVAIVLSFVFKNAFSFLLPKKQFISYSEIPAYIPAEISLELSGNEQADELITLSESHLAELQQLSKTINNEHLKQNIDELAGGLEQMATVLKQSPEKHRQIRQTLNYSVPTAIKLYKKYIELNAQTVKGSNILNSMEKINEMSNLVTSTFKRELDSLYQDQTLNIEVDVEVMRNMLQQESIEFSPIMRSLTKEDPKEDEDNK